MYRQPVDHQYLLLLAVLALVGYALYVLSSRVHRLENPPARRRRARPSAPPQPASVPVVHPRRKIAQTRASGIPDSDIEILSAESQGLAATSHARAGSLAPLPHEFVRFEPGPSSSRRRSRSRSVAPDQENRFLFDRTAEVIVGVNARAASPLVPVATVAVAIPNPQAAPRDRTPVALQLVRAGSAEAEGAPAADHPAGEASGSLPAPPQGSGLEEPGTPPQVSRALTPQLADDIARTERKVTPRKTKNGEQEPIETPYWAAATASIDVIPAPPDLTGRAKLSPGDIFIHRMESGRYQLWLWTYGEDGVLHWKPVRYGYRRADGRMLHVTPALVPGWVRTKLNYEMRRLDAFHLSMHT